MDIKFIISKVAILKTKFLFSSMLSVNYPNIQEYSQKGKIKKSNLTNF